MIRHVRNFGVLAIGLIALALAAPPSHGADPQAAPSGLPKSAATTQAVEGKLAPAPLSETGTQPAAPSMKPADEATPGMVDAPPNKKTD